jgi:hypothetical protein
VQVAGAGGIECAPDRLKRDPVLPGEALHGGARAVAVGVDGGQRRVSVRRQQRGGGVRAKGAHGHRGLTGAVHPQQSHTGSGRWDDAPEVDERVLHLGVPLGQTKRPGALADATSLDGVDT